ncbi:MAG: OmpH family outer membrane protein [Phycisphaerales bacterium]|nr:MAG: OmpH family outer membrane protein [Phycisphaerales bacterium]
MAFIPLFVMGLTLPAGQATGSALVAVVDVPAVSEQYKKTSDLEAQFEVKRRRLNQERDALRERIEVLRRSLQEEFKPGTEEFLARRKQLALLEAELQYFVESEGQGIEVDLARSLALIFADIKEMTRIVAQEKDIDVVLAADRMPQERVESATQVRQQILLQKVLFWSPKVDLTEEVTARLNAKYATESGRPSGG